MIPLGRPAIAIILSALLLLGIGPSANAQPENAEKTLSPYFLVKSDDPETDQLPLKSTAAEVAIAGVIADVVVTQVYENEGNRPLEAIYVFPASTRAAVHGMKMTIGERTIVAEIREREQARQEYEAAKEAGKSASLLEQQRPNVFQMNVANILPGDTIRVELRYTELLVPTDGVYAFVYPTVVGPRYSELPESGAPPSESWVRNPYLREGEPPPYDFDFRAVLSAGLPIAGVTSPSHEMDITFTESTKVEARLAAEDAGTGGDRDVILKYRLSGGQIETGLLLYEGETEKFFLMMMQPPQRVEADSIPPREYVFIVDVSGSMRGFPLDTAKTLLRDLIGNLRPTDRFNVLLFAGGSQIFEKRSVTATEANIGRAISFIDNQQGGGGTQILPAMRRALNLPAEGTVSRSMVVVTDGYVRVETEAFDLIRNNLGEANLFAFGIGSSVNRFLIEGMARVGMGEPFVVTKPAEAAEKAAKFREYVKSPVLTDIRLDFDGFDVYDVEPPGIPDLLAQRPLIAYGKWRGGPEGTIRLTGVTGGGPYSADLKVDRFDPDPTHAGLRYLWARKRISLLSDYNQVSQGEERAEEITELGLEYSLLTAYTSFVAIDSRVRTGEEATTVKQPLPLPRGVSDAAVGGMVPTMAAAPQPGRMSFERNAKSPGLVMREGAPAEAADAEKPAEPSPGVRVTILTDRLTVSAGLNPADVVSVIRRHLSEIESCAAKLIARDPTFRNGKLTLILTIDPNGQVTAAVSQGELGATPMGTCLTDLTDNWQFPKATGGNVALATVVLEVTAARR